METRSGASGSAGAAGTRVGRYRYLVVAVVWGAFFFGCFDRVGISLLLVDHAFLRDMGLEGSPEKQGLLMTFLLLPYALSNIFLGFTADRWGPRKVLTVMAGFWSAAALWMSAAGSYSLMLAGRVMRGTAEGPLFPVANRYVRYWFPPWERGGANALWGSGNRVGITLAVPLLALAIGLWGWRSAFVLQAVFILILVVPTIWSGKTTDDGLAVRLGGGTPVPESGIANGPAAGTSVVTRMVSVSNPPAVGPNVAWIVQQVPAASVAGASGQSCVTV